MPISKQLVHSFFFVYCVRVLSASWPTLNTTPVMTLTLEEFCLQVYSLTSRPKLPRLRNGCRASWGGCTFSCTEKMSVGIDMSNPKGNRHQPETNFASTFIVWVARHGQFSVACLLWSREQLVGQRTGQIAMVASGTSPSRTPASFVTTSLRCWMNFMAGSYCARTADMSVSVFKSWQHMKHGSTPHASLRMVQKKSYHVPT